MSGLPDDIRDAFTKLVITVDFIRRDLDETRTRLRNEFVPTAAYAQLVTTVGQLATSLDKLRQECEERDTGFRQHVEQRYVTKQEHAPLRLLVYGAAAIILSTVFGAIILLVVKKGVP